MFSLPMLPLKIMARLKNIAGEKNVLTSTADLYTYGFDASIHHQNPNVVVRVHNEEQVRLPSYIHCAMRKFTTDFESIKREAVVAMYYQSLLPLLSSMMLVILFCIYSHWFASECNGNDVSKDIMKN